MIELVTLEIGLLKPAVLEYSLLQVAYGPETYASNKYIGYNLTQKNRWDTQQTDLVLIESS